MLIQINGRIIEAYKTGLAFGYSVYEEVDEAPIKF